MQTNTSKPAGYTTHRAAETRASLDDGDTVVQLRDGSYAILGTPGYNNRGEAVQYVTLPRGNVIDVASARRNNLLW